MIVSLNFLFTVTSSSIIFSFSSFFKDPEKVVFKGKKLTPGCENKETQDCQPCCVQLQICLINEYDVDITQYRLVKNKLHYVV